MWHFWGGSPGPLGEPPPVGTGILRVSPMLGTWQPWHGWGGDDDTYGEVAASGVPKLSVMSPRGGDSP